MISNPDRRSGDLLATLKAALFSSGNRHRREAPDAHTVIALL